MNREGVLNEPIIIHKSVILEITDCNEACERYLGLPRNEIIGRTSYDLPWSEYADIYHQDDLIVLSGKSHSSIVPMKNSKNGECIVLGSKMPKRNEKGEIVGIVTYAMQIQNPYSSMLNYLSTHSCTPSLNNAYIAQNKYLSSRENECLYYLLRGHTAKRIGKFLNLSPKTVEHYVENLKLKFKSKNKSDLIHTAIEEGFINIIPKTIFSKKIDEFLHKHPSKI